MRAFSAANLRLESKVEFEPLGTTMAVSPVLPGASEQAVAESFAVTDNYNIIFVATETTEIKATINAFIQIMQEKSKNWTVKPYYIDSNNENENGKMTYKFDISLEIEKALNTHYNKDKENFVFVIVTEELVYSDTPTGLSLRNKVLNYQSGKIHLSIVSDYNSLPEESYFAKLVDITSGTVLNTNGYDKPSYLAWDIYDWLVDGDEIKYISSVNLTELPSVFSTGYLTEICSSRSNSGDYDKDGLKDYDEIAFESILVVRNPYLQMPTLNECINYAKNNKNAVYVEEAYARFENDEWKNDNELQLYNNYKDMINKVKIVPIHSDPTLKDGDGDGDDDIVDPHQLNCQLNDLFIDNISKLNNLADIYINSLPFYNPLKFNLLKYQNRSSEWLTFMYIRYQLVQINPKTKIEEHKYCVGNWPGIGGPLEQGFVDYIEKNDKSLKSYFEKTDLIKSSPNELDIDLYHMAATISAILYQSDPSDGGGSFGGAMKHGLLSENILNDLSGWAGDLQTFIVQCDQKHKSVGLSYSDYFKQKIGAKEDTLFSLYDLNADADAVNLTSKMLGPIDNFNSLEKVLKEYYSTGINKRFSSFINNALGVYTEELSISAYTKKTIYGLPADALSIKILGYTLFEEDLTWPIYQGYDELDTHKIESSELFWEFLKELRNNERN
jgi:hypothetical protein